MRKVAVCIATCFGIAFVAAEYSPAAFGNEPAAEIKAFCIDFNWGPGGPNGFAAPGLWADADPAEHVAWYKGLGANVIQTFCVSCNGYAWYKGGVVPEQPGLKHDFLTDVVRLGHREGMKVMGYFCVGANTRWAQEHPDQSYGNPSHTHIPFTTQYGDYLSEAVADTLNKTDCDGFMVDWFFNGPYRPKDARVRWLPCELQMWAELMDEPFPGKENTTVEQETEFKRRAVERLWTRLRRSAKAANPDCVIWLSCNDLAHPQLAGSKVFKEVDWLMNEAGDIESINRTRKMTGEHTRLVTCVVGWGDRHNARLLTTAAKDAGVGVYGFSRPGPNSLPLPIETYLAKPIDAFGGNNRNIATLARWYNGIPFDVVKDADGRFVAAPETIASEGLTVLKSLPDGAVNLARGAKADSPDDIPLHGSYPPVSVEGAIDGEAETYWDDMDDQKLYRLRVTFKKPTRVSALSITGWRHHDHAARDFAIVCDGKQIGTVENALYTNNRLMIGFPTTTCTTLELAIDGYYGASPAIRELEVFGD